MPAIILMCCLLLIGCQTSNRIESNSSCAQKNGDVFECLKYQLKEHRLPDSDQLEPLSYCQFIALKQSGAISHDQEDQLIDYAYANGNPVIFRRAQMPVQSNRYSLNFLWVHKKQPIDGHLMGANFQDLRNHLMHPFEGWQSMQPEADCNFWYDGDWVSNAAIERTKSILLSEGFDLTKLKFRDLHDIKLIDDNPELFKDTIPVSFRTDLGKASIVDHMLTTDPLPYVVIIDDDVAPITRAQLFDQRTMANLDSNGYDFGSAGAVAEISFIVMSSKAQKKHREQVINKAIDAAKKLIKEKKEIPEQTVFDNYTELQKDLGTGKPMVLPRNRLGGGYDADHTRVLKMALLRLDGCQD